MNRQNQWQRDFRLGLLVLVGFVGASMGAVGLATSNPWDDEGSTVRAHFRGVNGLARDSHVQLGGRVVGEVGEMSLVSAEYVCDPQREDRGVAPHRLDDCEPSLFCASLPQGGRCASLVPYSGIGSDYAVCSSDADCEATDVCMNPALRRRYPRVTWRGIDGWCAPFQTIHQRVEVTMKVAPDVMAFVRKDSVATISSSGVLGDQQVDITVGTDEPLEPGDRVRTGYSLVEELGFFREKIGAISDRIDRNLAGVVGLFKSIDVAQGPSRDVTEAIRATKELTDNMVSGEGDVGRAFQDPAFEAEFQEEHEQVDQKLVDLRKDVRKFERKAGPTLRDVAKTSQQVTDEIKKLRDPNNEDLVARAFTDQYMGDNALTAVASGDQKLERIRDGLVEINERVAILRDDLARKNGFLARLIRDPRMYDDLLKALGNTQRNQLMKHLVREVFEDAERREPLGPAELPAD